jgi:DNA-binding transcriptional MerR regulator
MRIGDVARLLDVTVPTIRHWQTEFPVPVMIRNGQRRFPQAAINRLRLIKQLCHVERYTILGARSQYDRLVSCEW